MTGYEKRSIPWVVVVLGLIIFWPVGLILLFKKLDSDRSATVNSGKLVAFISYVLILIGVFTLFGFIAYGGGFIVPILFIIGGIWVNRISRRTKATGERYKKYIALVVNQSQTSIDNIASAVGVSYEVAIADLQKMIAMGYFRGAQIDFARRSIGLPVMQVHGAPQGPAAFVEDRVVVCPGCGANNKVTARVSECEYCGSPIS